MDVAPPVRAGGFEIRPVRLAADLQATARLFQAYASGLDIDLGFQGFPAELAALPGQYAPPTGALLLACDGHGRVLGCVGLRPLRFADCCEMKRLYVSPPGRGVGLGRALVEAVIEAGVRIGYGEMRLDTLPAMAAAVALYRQAGFTPIDAYYDTPVAGTMFFGRSLTR